MIANVVAGAINRYTENGDNYVQNRSYATALQRADYMKENPIFRIREPSFGIYAGAN